MRVNKPVFDQETQLKEEDFLISRTDLQGKITYANPAFINISGYSREELIGADHNIVRHPDMPPAAFEDLWATVKKGELWGGVVKNRRKDGGFYWVKANVSPCYQSGKHVGFTSVRVKASISEIAASSAVYASLNANTNKYKIIDGVVIENTLAASIKAAIPTGIKAKLLLMTSASAALLGLSAVLGHVAAVVDDPSSRLDFANAQIGVALLGIVSLIYIGRTVTKSIIKPIHDCILFSSQLAAGNLSASLEGSANSDLKPVTDILDTIRKSMVSISADIRQNIHQFADSANEIISGNLDLSSRTEEQAAALQQTAASMEEITSTVQQNSGNATHASELTKEASVIVSGSGTIMGKVVNTMTNISQSSKEMSEHIDTIDSIAFQTNILALNASVEAARAGEQGRGFAVVADEVRNLASRSANAAKEIRQLISGSSRQIQEGEQLVKEAEKTIDNAVAAVGKVNDIMGEISSASSEQSIGIGQVNQAVAQMETVTTHNSSLVQNVSAISHRLEHQILDVKNAIAIYMVDDQQKKPERSTPKPSTRQAPPKTATPKATLREPKSYVLDDKARATPSSNTAVEADKWTTF
jgi:aerotaxis receptor